MRRKAGTTVLAAAGGVLTAALCGPLGAGAEIGAAAALQGRWRLLRYRREGALRDVLADVPVSATFDGATVAGNAGVNRYGGPFTVAGADLRIGPLAVTRMAGPEPAMAQEAAFLAGLARVASFAADGGTLSLRDEAGTDVLVFARGSDR